MTTAFITVPPGGHFRDKLYGSVHKNIYAGTIQLSAEKFESCADPSIKTVEGVRSEFRRWVPGFADIGREDFFPWPSPMRAKPKTPDVIPPFVAPEPPADPVEPTPAPDSPEVAVLRSLLGDRQRVRRTYDSDLSAEQEEIADLEKQLVEARKRAAHLETCIAAVDDEILRTTGAIIKLGGTVSEDVEQ